MTTPVASVGFGAYIKARREAQGLRLADVCGMVCQGRGGAAISIQYLHDIEHGNRHPRSHAMLRQLADALQVEYDYLCFLAGLLPDDVQSLPCGPHTVARAFAELRAALAVNREQAKS